MSTRNKTGEKRKSNTDKVDAVIRNFVLNLIYFPLLEAGKGYQIHETLHMYVIMSNLLDHVVIGKLIVYGKSFTLS